MASSWPTGESRPHRNFRPPRITSNNVDTKSTAVGSGYAPILAFCVIKHATTHVLASNAIYAAIMLECLNVEQHIGISSRNSHTMCAPNKTMGVMLYDSCLCVLVENAHIMSFKHHLMSATHILAEAKPADRRWTKRIRWLNRIESHRIAHYSTNGQADSLHGTGTHAKRTKICIVAAHTANTEHTPTHTPTYRIASYVYL